MAIQAGLAYQLRLRLRPPAQVDHGHGIIFFRPVGELLPAAVPGLHHPQQSVCEIQLEIRGAEQVLSQEAGNARQAVVAADQELDIVERGIAQREIFHRRDLRMDRSADAADEESEGSRLQVQLVLRRDRGRDHLEEGAGVHDEPRLGTVDPGGDQRLRAVHRDGKGVGPQGAALGGLGRGEQERQQERHPAELVD